MGHATTAARMPRDAIKASLWIFDPTTEEEDAEVEAMDSGLVVERNDEDRIIVSVRGRPHGRRYEHGDSVWLEIEDGEALRLIVAVARALGEEMNI